MNQIEFSRTLILDRPARARAFFDRVVECSTTLGRPSEIELIFGRRVQKNTPGMFRTVVMHEGVELHSTVPVILRDLLLDALALRDRRDAGEIAGKDFEARQRQRHSVIQGLPVCQ